MAYDEYLAERISRILSRNGVGFYEKKMFGGVAFMVDEKMCVGVVKEQLMARVGPENMETAMAKPGAGPMEFTGRAMKGYVFVQPEGMDAEADLEFFLELALAHNPLAKASKKKKKKSR